MQKISRNRAIVRHIQALPCDWEFQSPQILFSVKKNEYVDRVMRTQNSSDFYFTVVVSSTGVTNLQW